MGHFYELTNFEQKYLGMTTMIQDNNSRQIPVRNFDKKSHKLVDNAWTG